MSICMVEITRKLHVDKGFKFDFLLRQRTWLLHIARELTRKAITN